MLGPQLQLKEINKDKNTKLKDLGLIVKLKRHLFKKMICNKLQKAWKSNKFKH